MKFSEAWLREWVNPPVSTTELADQLSMAGLEVDSVASVAPAFSGVVVGEVLSVEDHPDASKLHVCRVNVGGPDALTIVCGAANVAEGMRVPTAMVGAVLPDDFKIKKAKLRGVESFGMLCAASELGLAETSEGLMSLPTDAPIGADLRTYLQLDDQAIELDLTPDRGDCLSIAGVAREVGVINRCPVTVPLMAPVAAEIDDTVSVSLEAGDACPRYLCRVVREINPAAETPDWMKERLRRSDIRGISPVVDVTNYVLLELGQPMHGFDLQRIDGGIVVRMARAGERLALLDTQEIELRADTLVIADASRPLALAGIMGGEASGVTETTRNVLLESAFFAPAAVVGKARGYGLHTDSSHRFERGVDPELQERALERATRLLIDIAGGKAGPVVEVNDEAHLPVRPKIMLRRNRVSRVLGIEIDPEQIEEILTRLEMTLDSNAEGWLVTPPSNRFDIAIEVDLIEEIGRIYGYEAIPVSAGHAGTVMSAAPERAFDLARARQALVERGYNEVITYSFISAELQGLFDSEHRPVALANPISADMSVMRTSLWPGLVSVLRYNQARQREDLRLFESGLRFVEERGELNQDRVLSGLISGNVREEQWGERPQKVDFFDLKSDIEALLKISGQGGWEFIPAEHRCLHPGQSARVERAGQFVGWLGMLHPALAKRLDLTKPVFVFELLLQPLDQGRLPAFAPLSKFPSIRRDLAVVVDRAVSFSQIQKCVRAAEPEILRDIRLFDVYTGEKIDSRVKSLALGLILQESSRTLTDEDVDRTINSIIQRLEAELGARLRD